MVKRWWPASVAAVMAAAVLTSVSCGGGADERREPPGAASAVFADEGGGVTSSAAARTTSVCHYDAAAGTYKLLTLTTNGANAHWGHGDVAPVSGVCLPPCPCFTTAEIDATSCALYGQPDPPGPLCPSQISSIFGLYPVEGIGWECGSVSQSGYYVVVNVNGNQCAALTPTRGYVGPTALNDAQVASCGAAIEASQLFQGANCPS